jgi:TRAP-type transport system periplasmic protein
MAGNRTGGHGSRGEETMKRTPSKRLIISLLCALAVFMHVLFLPADASDGQFNLKFTNFLPNQHFISLSIDQWARDVEKATKGRVKVKVYHNAAMATSVQQYDAVTKGIADIGNHVPGYTVNRFPLSEVIDLPLGVPNAVVASKMMNEYFGRMKPKEFDEIKALWLHGHGPGYLCMRSKPVQRMGDLKGLRIRTYGSNARFMQALGAIPVGMPMADAYEALAGGVVDGLLSSLESLKSYKTGEHVRTITQNRWTAYTTCMVVVMNKRIWNSLPLDIQNVMDALSREQPEKFGKAWDDAEAAGRSFLDQRGVRYISLTKEEEHRWVDTGAHAVFEDYIRRMKEKGLPGDEAVKFVIDYLRPYKK